MSESRHHMTSTLYPSRLLVSLLILLACKSMLVGKESPFRYADINSPDFFPILPWDAQSTWYYPFVKETNSLESIADCHFNMAGFVQPKDLARCKKLGLGAIVLSTDSSCTNFEYYRQWKKLSDTEIDRRVRDMVRGAGRNPAVVGYFITDEPSASEFPALRKAVDAVKKYAPGKLAYINLFPENAIAGANETSQLGTTNYEEYLERFIAEVRPQCLSYDNYTIQYSSDQRHRAIAASYYRNLLEIRRVAQKHDLPFLNIVCVNQLVPGYPPPSPANLLLQAYTTLAAGYRGVTWYAYYGRGYRYGPIGMDGEKTLSWPYLKEVNRQIATLAPTLCRLKSTGVFFSSPAPADGLPQLPGELITAVTSEYPVMVGELSDASGIRYAIVVNLSVERSTRVIPTTKTGNTKLEMVSAIDGRPRILDLAKEEFWLNPGQGVLLRLVPTR